MAFASDLTETALQIVWKFSKIRPMYDKCMTKMITFAIDKTS